MARVARMSQSLRGLRPGDMYVLLAGEVDIETDLGVVEAKPKPKAFARQARLLPSEVFGEAGAMGSLSRNASARAWKDALLVRKGLYLCP